MNSKNTRTLAILMFVTCKNTKGYKENVIYFIMFDFGLVITIIYWMGDMKPYVLDIVKSHENKIIVYLRKSGTTELLLHIKPLASKKNQDFASA